MAWPFGNLDLWSVFFREQTEPDPSGLLLYKIVSTNNWGGPGAHVGTETLVRSEEVLQGPAQDTNLICRW